jgi:DNA mismatch repair protein MutH
MPDICPRKNMRQLVPSAIQCSPFRNMKLATNIPMTVEAMKRDGRGWLGVPFKVVVNWSGHRSVTK